MPSTLKLTLTLIPTLTLTGEQFSFGAIVRIPIFRLKNLTFVKTSLLISVTVCLHYNLEFAGDVSQTKTIIPAEESTLKSLSSPDSVTQGRLTPIVTCQIKDSNRETFATPTQDPTNRSRHRMCSVKKTFLKISEIFTGKHLCWSILLIKLQALITPILKYISERLLLSEV